MPQRKESLRTWGFRLFFNLFPAYRGTGGRVTFIASDWSEIRVQLPLNLWTRNYVGTIFGGSLYGSMDPMFMIMLIQRLGKGYLVWDKAANIKFIKPGKNRLYATFDVSDEEVEAIRHLLEDNHSVDRTYQVDLADAQGLVCASVEKTIYIRKKNGG